jgi:hypothetical protein
MRYSAPLLYGKYTVSIGVLYGGAVCLYTALRDDDPGVWVGAQQRLEVQRVQRGLQQPAACRGA